MSEDVSTNRRTLLGALVAAGCAGAALHARRSFDRLVQSVRRRVPGGPPAGNAEGAAPAGTGERAATNDAAPGGPRLHGAHADGTHRGPRIANLDLERLGSGSHLAG